MASRIELHEKLCALLGSRNVYFQPPENLKLKYPCIVYELSDMPITRADDKIYTIRKRYFVTIIFYDPDSTMAEEMLNTFQYCSYDRRFVNDNLYHDAMTIYY